MRVLLVEDDPKMADLVRRGLTENGTATDVAPHGEDALWMARALEYDAIVLDVMLPGRDGFATCGARYDGTGTRIVRRPDSISKYPSGWAVT